MPIEEEEVGKKRDEEGGEREIWVSFSFNSGRRSGDSSQTPTSDSNDPSDSSSSPRPDHETEV
jgi:hypothetical protein